MTDIGGVQTYWYDANGNVTQRGSGSPIYPTYDAENRLTGMSGAATETHVYDGDGVRVRAVITTPVSMTSIYVGNYFEITGGITRTYYYAGNVRVAERYGNTLYYLLTDHLGSTAVTTSDTGVRVTELRYYPYGKDRYNGTNQKTTYRFTGQRWDPGTALYFYGSRWYDPVIGRFLSADSIVPQPGNPQSLNRYSYVLNSPLRYTDPTGHCALIDEEANGLCVRYAQDGTLRIVHGGAHFANPVETGIANAFLSGDSAYLAAIPADTPPLFLQQSVNHVAAELGLSAAGTGIGQLLLDPALIIGASMAIVKVVENGGGENWLNYVPEKYRASVSKAFAGTPTVETLTEGLVVYRHWGGEAAETDSPWYSPVPYTRPGNARRYLSLPMGNTAENASVFRIPAGATILRGKVASQVGDPLFGPYAVGGGIQIYVPNPNDAILLGPLDVTNR